jgi:hypothetical protein
MLQISKYLIRIFEIRGQHFKRIPSIQIRLELFTFVTFIELTNQSYYYDI